MGARRTQHQGPGLSNVFDLKSGEIFLFHFPEQSAPVKLQLDEELGKGRHYYDMGKISEQMTQKPQRPSRLKEWGKTLYCWLRWNG